MIMKVDKVVKRFGGLTAVNEVTFDVEKGSITGIIGPNGSGKTTLINMINGTHHLTKGNIIYKDQSIKDLKSFQRARLGIARTFQIVKPLRDITLRDNIMTAALFGKNQFNTGQEIRACLSSNPIKDAYRDTDEIIEITGLKGKQDKFARNLTLPDLKRLELARALAMNPEVLLLDEVMAGLNAREVEDVMEIIRSINRKGVTIIIIEHIMKVIMGIADEIVVIHQGNLICKGNPKYVSNHPKVVEAYLGKRYKEGGNKLEPI